ncbi:MAG: type I methionyl aminopeptidase [Myxococcota bacterium]|nr:type I methionyl aminopeptidase [Myxococcota bacterium]
MGKPMVILSAKEIDKMRIAGRFAAELLDHLGGMLKPGITTQALNDEAEKLTQARKAKSAPLGYHGFPRSICTSVNDVVCHGIPSKEHVLKDGDIINIDVTPIVDGYYGDTSRTFFVGKPTPQAKALVDVTLECLKIGIREVAPGKRVGDIGAAIQEHAESFGYGVVRDFVGHGIGREFHIDPQVPHYGRRGTGPRLKPGMAFTIEPMINQGDWRTVVLEDDWTAVTVDGGLSAQFEHTLVVTKDGFEIMTLKEGDTFI